MASRAECSIDAVPYRWPYDRSMTSNNTALLVVDMQRDFDIARPKYMSTGCIIPYFSPNTADESVCEEGGYLSLQGYDIQHVRDLIPVVRALLSSFREGGYQVLHTREGHRPDLTDLPARELFRSRNNPSNIGIGDAGPLGRLLVRGEPGHDTIPELCPLPGEAVIDKPGKSAFYHTDLDLILRSKGIRNLVFCGVTTDVCVHTTMRDANDLGYDCLLVSDACAAAEQDLHDAAVKSVKMEGGVFGAVTTADCVIEELTDRDTLAAD